MKKSNLKTKSNISRIPISKNSINKLSLQLSQPFSKKCKFKPKNDSLKDTVDGTIAESQTYHNPLLDGSLKSTKLSNQNNFFNYSLGRKDKKLNIYAYNLKNSLNKGNNSFNFSKEYKNKVKKDNSENISSSEDDIISVKKKSSSEEYEDEDTNKIDYRYYPKMPEIEGNIDKNKSLYWLATYDKLMKKSKIIKILSYYNDSLTQKNSEVFVIEDANSDYKEEETKERLKMINEKYNFKENTMIVQGYEIYFVKKHGKPFVRQKKGSKIFIKLYLLSLEQINQIFSYINRLEYKNYIKNLNSFNERNSYRIINNFNKSIYNYSKIFCLGSFMNTNIYLFSHSPKIKDNDSESNDYYNSNYLLNNLPSSNKIAKLIKVLMMNFPEFSKQYFIDYLIKPRLNSPSINNLDIHLLQQKMKEVNSLLITNNKNEVKIKNNNTNNIIKRTIRAIPTYSISSFKTPNNANNVNYINNDIYCSDFLSDIKNDIASLVNFSKKNSKSINESSDKIYKTKTNKIKLDKNIITRNNQSILDKINNDKSYSKTNESKTKEKKNPFRTITLKNLNNKKSLTRTNSKMILSFNNLNNNIQKKKSNIIKLGKVIDYENKENDMNFSNINLKDNYNSEEHNFISSKIAKIKNSQMLKKNQTNIFSLNKNNPNSPYFSNINSVEKKFYTQTNADKNLLKRPNRVISSIQKKIVDKANIMGPFSDSIQITKAHTYNLLKDFKNNLYENEYMNNIHNSKKENKKNSSINNNSVNKITDYITPLKKKYFYYYH